VSDPGETAPPPSPPPPDAVLGVDPEALAGKLLSIPDAENTLLRLADGRRTVTKLLLDAGLDRAEALASLSRLLDAGVLRVLPPGSAVAPSEQHGPDGAEWFAQPQWHPDEQPEEAAPPSGDPVPSPAARGEAGAPGGTRAWAVVAAVALGAVLLAGTWWTGSRRDRSRTAAPPASTAAGASGAERPGGGAAPPALSITEPATSTAYREAMEEVGARYQKGDLPGAAAAVQLAAGDRGAARDAFVRYLALEPEGRHAPRIRALLARLRP
jgi:hypothetical protein